uniref:Transcription factor domain-containing protein n=1 Tax=Bionectria ochroleuca TaxID=29856 RepID=A0A0B7KNY3_BIOOC
MSDSTQSSSETRQCIYNLPAIKRKRKRNETRIRELEQKLEEVQQSISDQQGANRWTPLPSEVSPMTEPIDGSLLTASQITDGHSGCESLPGITEGPFAEGYVKDDPISRGIVDESLADKLCIVFCTEMLPHYPLILPPAPISYKTLRDDRPAILRAIIATASSIYAPDLWKSLFQDAERYIMEQALMRGRKSLDLIQAALLLATWSHPPKNFEDLNFGQFVNIAATMILDLRSSNDPRYLVSPESVAESTQGSLEVARTFLACYLLSSSIAMSLRRPNTMPYNTWVGDCLAVLNSTATTHIGDRRLVAWIHLQKLAEETLAMAGIDGNSSGRSTDSRTHLILKSGLERVKAWRQTVSDEITHDTLNIHYHVILLNLSEPGLHGKHNANGFRPPYSINTRPAADPLIQNQPQFIDARMKCLEVGRKMMQIFKHMSAETIRQKPVITFTRIMYAAVIIVKLAVFEGPNSEHSSEIDSDMEVLHQIHEKLASAAEGSRYLVPATFCAVLRRLLSRCVRRDPQATNGHDALIEPLANLELEDSPVDHSSTHSLVDPVIRDPPYLPEEGHQLSDIGPASLGMEIQASSNLFALFDDHVPSTPDDVAAAMLWNNFLSEDSF